MLDLDARIREPRPVGVLMEMILHELEESNRRRNDIERRLTALESKDRVLSAGEAARYCGVSRQTINAWIRRKRLTRVELSGKVGVLLSELKQVKTINDSE